MNPCIFFFILLVVSTSTIIYDEISNVATISIQPNQNESYCIEGRYLPQRLWSTRVVNITSSYYTPVYLLDSPDSSLIRVASYLFYRITKKGDINSNMLYDITKVTKNSHEMYLSPYGNACYILLAPPRVTESGVVYTISVDYKFDMFCPIRLLIGVILLILSAKLSRSKSFYYITAASLSALLGVLIIVFYIMRKMQASNTSMGIAAALYSFGLTGLFRHSALNFLYQLVIQHWRLVSIYLIVFAFLGVIVVKLKIFNSPTSNPTSLFQIVRWGIMIVSVSLIVSSTASVCGSFLSFLLLWIGMALLKWCWRKLYYQFQLLRFKFFPPKRVFKTLEEYDEECRTTTKEEMMKLRSSLLSHPELLSKLSCNPSTLITFLLSGIDIVDGSVSVQQICQELMNHSDNHSEHLLAYLYDQRNNRNLFDSDNQYCQYEGEKTIFKDTSIIEEDEANDTYQPNTIATSTNNGTNSDLDTEYYTQPRKDTSDAITHRRETIGSAHALRSTPAAFIPRNNGWE